MKSGLSASPVLTQSFNEIKSSVDIWLGKDIDVPVPKDPAGGYTHEKHKENYNLMFRLIKEGEVKFPNQINISPLAKDFIKKVILIFNL